MSSNSSWVYKQDTSSNSDLLVLLGIALGSGILFIIIAISCECFFYRRRRQVSTRAPIDQSNYINRSGLSISDVNSIPTFEYKRFGDDNIGGRGWAQCSVCLNLVQEREKVRQLSNCKHFFHPECIDMWLYSHSTCPLCRSTVNPVHEENVDVSSQV